MHEETREQVIRDGPLWQRQPAYPLDVKLNVVIVFHSHNDPGWLDRLDYLFDVAVASILDNTVQALNTFPDLKFVQAELVFFERWWTERTDNEREQWRK